METGDNRPKFAEPIDNAGFLMLAKEAADTPVTCYEKACQEEEQGSSQSLHLLISLHSSELGA